MDPALKQRLVGAVVLVALAVIFLPMLIKGPAPESGVADVSMDVPEGPGGGFETRELPLVTPSAAPSGGVVGMDAGAGDPRDGGLPTVDTADGVPPGEDGEGFIEHPSAAELADAPGGDEPPVPSPPTEEAPRTDPGAMFPAPTAGGDWAVSFGTYSGTAAADRMVADLRASQLPGFREQARVDGKTVYRVRIGPYDSEATAEAARLRAAHVRDDVGARVVALESGAPAPRAPAEEASAPEPPAPVEATPAPAADTGFVVQLGAFSEQGDVDALLARVRGAGFSVFTEQVATDRGRLTRVLVGPAFDRAEADRLKAQVQARLGIDGLVRGHP